MLKRGLYLFVLSVLFPCLASAASWSLNTWVKSAGGNIVIRNGTPQTSVNGSVFKSYTTSKPVSVTVNASSGYAISALTYNGVAQALPIASPRSYTVQGPTAQNVHVTFLPQVMAVSATAGAGGTVSPPGSLSNVYYGAQSPARAFTFSPNPGNNVIDIAVNGSSLPASGPDLTYTLTNAVTGAAVTLPAPKDVRVKLSISRITYNLALAGTFVSVVAKAGMSQTVTPNTPVTLDGSGSTGPITTYTWTQTGGPAVTLSGANTASPTFTPTVAANYQFQLVVASGSSSSAPSTVVVYVTDDPAEAARAQCQNCHGTNGVGAATNVYRNWSSSRHRANLVLCHGCHIGANTGNHPGQTLATLANICKNCHVDAEGNVPGHMFAIGSNACTSCHEPHSTAPARMVLPPPHYNAISSAGYPASYVTSRSTCSDCHSLAADNAAVRHDWAGSGHGDTRDTPWSAEDFKARTGCVRCHTATGYVNYVSSPGFTNVSAWGDASDTSKEVLSCRGCHNPDFSRRSVPLPGNTFTWSFQVNPGAVVSTSYQYSPSYWISSTSNLCMPCHTGTTSGEIIKQAAVFADFTAAGRLSNHAMVAGGMIGKVIGVGYNYDETTYQNKHNTWHYYIGIGNARGTGTSGPCIACHMKTPDQQHSFAAVFTNSTGNITGIRAQGGVCDGCHPSLYVAGPMDVNILKNRKAGFAVALSVLKAQLQKAGFDPDSPAPRNWGATSRSRANNLGAYYNYFLLRDGDKGAYVHGPAYTKRLILASLDWLDDNTFNQTVYATTQVLATEGRITPAVRDSARLYLNIGPSDSKTGYCLNCHAY